MVSKVFTPTPPDRDTTASDADRESSFDNYSISSISSDSAPRPIVERPTIPFIPLTMGKLSGQIMNVISVLNTFVVPFFFFFGN